MEQIKFKVSEIEVVLKRSFDISKRPQIRCGSDAVDILKDLWDENLIELQEQFKIVYLNAKNNILGIYNLSTGGMTSTVVDIRLIFGAAFKMAATKILIAHNHPSETLRPSQADVRMTARIKEVGTLLDIELLDHVIVTSKSGYYSFAEEGLL